MKFYELWKKFVFLSNFLDIFLNVKLNVKSFLFFCKKYIFYDLQVIILILMYELDLLCIHFMFVKQSLITQYMLRVWQLLLWINNQLIYWHNIFYLRTLLPYIPLYHTRWKNYWAISLLSHIYKLFSRVIMNRLARRLNEFRSKLDFSADMAP